MTKDLEEETATSTRQYMETESGKFAILNPPERVPISKFRYWNEEKFTSEINSRLNIYVAKVIQTDTFVTKNKDIQERTISFYKEICKELDDNEEDDLKYEQETSAEVTSEMEISTHIWLPFIVYIGYLSLPFGIILGGVYLFLHWNKEARRNEVIDRAYEQCKKEVPASLEKECCFLLRKLITKVMLDLLPRRLNGFKERLCQLREMHENDLAKQNLLRKVRKEVTSLKEKAVKLKGSVN